MLAFLGIPVRPVTNSFLVWDGAKGAFTTSALTFDGSILTCSASIQLPDPANNKSILFGSHSSITGNSAGVGVTCRRQSSGSMTFTILRPDYVAGAQDIGNYNYEMVNSVGGVYRLYMYGQQTSGVSGAETGYFSFATMSAGVQLIDIVQLGNGGVPLICKSTGAQAQFRYDASNVIGIQHNGTNGYIGTTTNQPLVLRTNGADAITVSTAQAVTLAGTLAVSSNSSAASRLCVFGSNQGSGTVLGTYNSWFISDNQDTSTTAGFGFRVLGATTIAGIRYQLNSTSAAFIDAVTFDSSGNAAATKTLVLQNGAGDLQVGGNVALFAAGSFGSGTKVVFIANATSAPSTNPAGGGVLYCEAGALKYRGSSGTVTTLGPA